MTAVTIDYAVGGANRYIASNSFCSSEFTLSTSIAGDTQTIVAFNMGGLQASAVGFQIQRTVSNTKKFALVTAITGAFTAPVGGVHLTAAVADTIIDAFNHKHGVKLSSPIETNFKALAKVSRAAKEAKEALSSSPTTTVQIDNLHEGKQCLVSLKVADFETRIAHLVSAAIAPLSLAKDAVQAGEVTVFELFGGGLRVPYVAKAIKDAHPSVAVGKHINGDEAAIFGAAYLVATQEHLPGLKTDLIFIPDSDGDLSQSLANPATPLSATVMADYAALLERLDAFELARLERQRAEDDL